MSKLYEQTVFIEIPYVEATHIQNMLKSYQDHSSNPCLLCSAAISHFSSSIIETARNEHNSIKRLSIKKNKYKGS